MILRIAGMLVIMLIPKMWASPSVGGVKPVKQLIVVDFPAPLGPRRHKIVLFGQVNSKGRRAVTPSEENRPFL
jgi:hypothetical protein